MNSNIINVILIKKCYQKGTFVKDATNISSDMKNLLTLGNSVSLENYFLDEWKEIWDNLIIQDGYLLQGCTSKIQTGLHQIILIQELM